MGVVQHSVLESGFEDTAWPKQVAWSMELGAWSFWMDTLSDIFEVLSL